MVMSIWDKTVYNPYMNPKQRILVRQPTREEQENMREYLEKLHKKMGIKKIEKNMSGV